MKFDIQAFNTVVSNPVYEGRDTYLIDDDKNMIDYHIYLFLIESDNVAAIICEKLPLTPDTTENYEVYEFNGNKLLEHKVVRLKALDKNSNKYKSFVSKYVNKEFQFANK